MDETPEERARELVKAWRTIRRRIAARYRIEQPQFMAVFEATKRGEPHLHIVARMPFVDQRWLSAQMAELMDSPIVDIRRIRSGDKAAAYVAKYLGKEPHRFEGTKRFWNSLYWRDRDDIEDRPPKLFGDSWIKHARTLDQIEDELLTMGFGVSRDGDRLIFESGSDP